MSKKFKQIFSLCLIVIATLTLSSCTGHDMYRHIDNVKEALQLDTIKSSIYEDKGGGPYFSGSYYEILYSDMNTYDVLSDRLNEEKTFDCFESKDGRICERGTVTIVLGKAENSLRTENRWNKQLPYVYLTIKDSSGGQQN